MVRNVHGYKMANKLPRGTKTYVRSESGATTLDMWDYVNPSRRRNPDLFILHTGTNDLRSGKQPEDIANEIIELALDIRTGENEVAISELVIRNDKLNEKGKKVNECLKAKTSQHNLGFVEHHNITKEYLNNGGLHLTEDGDDLLSNNFVNFINI